VLAAPVAVRSQQPPPPSQGQTSGEAKIRQQREELERIRRERQELQRNMTELQSKAHDLDAEVTNLHQQADATARVVRSLDVQLETITTEVDGTTASLLRAEDELAVKKAVLQRRLIDIYKRGPMYTTEALLAARTFGELLGRYKYLHELALRDRSLVARVEDLYDQVAKQRQQLVRLRDEFERSRQEKREEEDRLRALEESRSRNLNVIKRSAKETEARLAAIGRDETRLTNTIAAFEEARKKAAERPNAPAVLSSSTLKTSDFGKLDWPVEGSIIYRFGRAVNPNNTTIRWNGVGIAAPSGASVKAVAGGEVMVAEAIGSALATMSPTTEPITCVEPETGSKSRKSAVVTMRARSSTPKATPSGACPKPNVRRVLSLRLMTVSALAGVLGGSKGPKCAMTRKRPSGDIAMAPGCGDTLMDRWIA
jgi:septal ring factor EnvC (AmiA/AmiB activator)